MSRVNTIIGQLQDTLKIRFDGGPDIVDTEGALSGGPEFINQYPPDEDEDIDVPQTPETDYVTHRTFVLPTAGKKGNKLPFESKSLKEQEDEDDPLADDTEMGEEEAAPETADVGGDVGDVGDVGGDVGGMDADMGASAGIGGMPGMEQEEPKTAGQLGRIYELKKIYSRLTSIESYLGNESSTELLDIRNLVSKSIELFEIVSANFDSYEEKLDEIIVMYYKFIMEVYKEVESYFKNEAKNSGD